MWFCHKCKEWFEDGVFISKHFKRFHSKPKSSAQKSQNNNNASSTLSNKKTKTPSKPELSLTKNASLSVFSLPTNVKSSKIGKKRKIDDDDEDYIPGFENKKKCSASKTVENCVIKKIKIMPVKDISKNISNKGEVFDQNKTEQNKTYICKFCCRRFYSSDLLKIHQKCHGNTPFHVCYICGLQSATFSALMAHFVKHASLKEVNINTLNKSTISNNIKDKNNVPVNKPEMSITCTQCKRSFQKKEVFSTHYCPPLNKKTEYKCAYCRKVTLSVEEYRDHIQSHSTSPYICPKCGLKFEKKIKLDQHIFVCKQSEKSDDVAHNVLHRNNKKQQNAKSIKQQKPVLKFSCPHCSADFEKSISLTQHIKKCPLNKNIKQGQSKLKENEKSPKKVRESNDNSTRTCPFCSTLFGNQNLREQHVQECNKSVKPTTIVIRTKNVHNSTESPKKNTNNYACLNCYDKFKTQNELNRHHESCLDTLNNEHDSSYETNDTMQPTRRSARLVNKKKVSFSSIYELYDEPRIRTRQSSNAIKMNLEESVTSNDNEIAEEERSEPDVQVKVELVEKSEDTADKINGEECTNNKYVKKKFLKREPLEKKKSAYFCNLCTLNFCSIGSLKRHRRMHTGKPQFVCQYCGKFFFRKDIFLRHEKNVHDKVTAQVLCCFYCKENFDNSSSLKEHVTTTHAELASILRRVRRGFSRSPSKKRFLNKNIKSENLEDLNSELEPELPDEIKDSNSSTNSSLEKDSPEVENFENKNSYECGMCCISFVKLPLLIQHFKNVHGISDFVNIVQKQQSDTKNIVKLENTKLTEKKPVLDNENESTVSDNSLTLVKNKSNEGKVFYECKSTSEQNKNKSSSSQIIQNIALDIRKKNFEKYESECRANTDLEKSYLRKALEKSDNLSDTVCRLCFKTCTNKEQLHLHKKLLHKVIDWYQCLICDVEGSKTKIQEHMMEHTNKIGTFIMTDDQNFNVSAFLPQNKQNDEFQSNPVSQICRFDPSLPPLVCTNASKLLEIKQGWENTEENFILNDEVKCVNCGDLLKDVQCLVSHKCLETSSENFLCVVEDCKYNCHSRLDMENHLKYTHCEINNGTHVSMNSESNCLLNLQMSDVENIILEPSIEILTGAINETMQ